jgi:hypothetical protein
MSHLQNRKYKKSKKKLNFHIFQIVNMKLIILASANGKFKNIKTRIKKDQKIIAEY